MSKQQPDTAFVAFDSPEYGIRAATVLIRTYSKKYGLKTVRGIISRWAPPQDRNNTTAYIERVSAEMGVSPDDPLDLDSADTLLDLTTAMMGVEIGRVPYDAGVIMAGVRLGLGDTTDRPPLTDQPSPSPTRKVSNGALGSLVGIPVAWLIKVLWDTWIAPQEPIPAETAIVIASALTTAFYFIVAYMTRERAAI